VVLGTSLSSIFLVVGPDHSHSAVLVSKHGHITPHLSTFLTSQMGLRTLIKAECKNEQKRVTLKVLNMVSNFKNLTKSLRIQIEELLSERNSLSMQ
jgi:hypothetical protein